MKNKKFKSFICFLLCFVLLFSFPFNTTAHAAVAAPYVMYAIITYLASLGITFTVAGGVDAMIQAMEEKVDEYQKQAEIIDFYDIVRSGLKIVPPPNGGPNWDKNKGYFFLAFNAATALTAFADWLISDGVWGKGQSVEHSLYTQYLVADMYENGVATVESVKLTPTVGEGFYWRTYEELGSLYTFDEVFPAIDNKLYIDGLVFPNNVGISGFETSTFYYEAGGTNVNPDLNLGFKIGQVRNGSRLSGTPFNAHSYYTKKGYTFDDIIGFTYVHKFGGTQTSKFLAIVFPDNNILLTESCQSSAFDVTDEVTIETPLEFPQLFPTEEEGVLIDTGATAAETLEELGELFETVFTDTGTIPQPQPEVITDPDYAPQPTPAPTPVPSPEIEDIEDLGLPALGEAIFNKFPFSLPKDIARVFDILTADPVTPYWEVDLTNDAIGISSKFVIDLEPYEMVGQICRWVSVISFSLFLIIITKGMIGW